MSVNSVIFDVEAEIFDIHPGDLFDSVHEPEEEVFDLAGGDLFADVVLDDASPTAPVLSPIERIRLTAQLGAAIKELQAVPEGPAGMLQRLKATAKVGELVRKLGGGVAGAAESAAKTLAETAPAPIPEATSGAASDVTETLAETSEEQPAITVTEAESAFGLQASGKKTRERINAAVVDIVTQIKAGKDPKTLTAEDLALLKQYSGKGGLTDNSQYEYYTPTPVAEGVWDILKVNGFENGNVLEPSAGAGVFSATKPAGTVITGTEIDGVAATVNQVLHPEDQILNQSFEKLAVSAPDSFFDAVTGNVPFGDARGVSANDDPAYKSEKRIERYFINRVIDKTRPGGLITLIVPTAVIGNLSGPWKKFRATISRKAEFLGGHKLPSKTFGKQGTDVVTDIIVLRKHPADLLDKIDGLSADTLAAANVLWPEFIDGKYWLGEGKRFIHGQYIPPDATKARSMEQVIPEDGHTPEALKQKLAVKFDSRIDWALLDSAEPVINYYAAGDRRIIGGKEYTFDGAHWAEVDYRGEANETRIDAAKYGADSLENLAALLASPESMLNLTCAQAFAAYKTYPNLLGTQQRMAVEFAMNQPAEKFREQAYRGSLVGSVVSGYTARANAGNAPDGNERDRVRTLVEREFATFGHPKSVKGFLLEGDMARYFGAYLGAVDEQGNVSKVLAEGVEQAKGYEPANVLSITEYLVREQGGEISLEDVAKLYTGPRALRSLGDLADVDGLAITPAGFISTTKTYCCGDIYLKAAELQDAMAGETDPRVKDKFQKQIDLMVSKAKHTSIEDISFGLRDKWLDRRYQLEFLKESGYEFSYITRRAVQKVSETGEAYEGFERVEDTTNPNGEWVIGEYAKKRSDFARQLEHYMNGKSIGHDVRDKGGLSAAERIAGFREQVNALEEQFKYFMQSHPDFAEIERVYNATFNNYVRPEYDTADLGLEGMSGRIKLHWYQNQGVRQLSEQGTGILGFDVGLGKSFSALALSAYDRQMGRSRKHCIVVPNSVLANWYMESKTLYGHHDDVMFVGFEPKRDPKTGEILREPILDESGNPHVNRFTGEIEYQDILVKDSPEAVYEKMHQIPHTSKAVVIMTEEKFGTIPMREESRLKYAQKWAEKSMMSAADARKAAGITEEKTGKSYAEDKTQNRLEQQFSDDGTAKKGELPYFEDMGFDRVIVDEAHRFRNSFQIQDGDTAKLAYLPNPQIAKRASDMAMKMAWLREKYDGKGAILLTATPVANSPIEIFNMLSLVVDQSEFERLGIYTADDFVRQFGTIKMVDKLTVKGTVDQREGLAGFKNLNALRGLFHRYALMRGAQDVDPEGNSLKLPEAVEMIDQAEMDEEQQSLYVRLREEARDAGNPQKIKSGEARPMFAVMRDMDRVTTDIDLYHRQITFLFRTADQAKIDALIADLPQTVKVRLRDDDSGEKAEFEIGKETGYSLEGDTLTYVAPEGYEEAINSRLTKFKIDYVNHPLRPKYAKLIANMQAELDSRGKQLVFTEEKSQHGKLARIIINHLPVTADQVAIINADTAGGEKLQQISDAYNRGDIRIIIANKKAEVGVNLQKGTSAIHHMTLPWNPASLQQRNGRGVRQGNTVSQVRVYYYQAKGSFDEYRLDLLKNKGNWIAALMDHRNEQDFAENAEAMGAIEQAALLSENREEFLKTMAEVKAKKEAEEKARRDNAAKVKLNQLALIELNLQNFDASKAKAVQDAQKKIADTQAKLDKAVAEGADAALIERLQRDVAIATNRAGKVDGVWEDKKAQYESQRRQINAFLRGQDRKGELPFDAAALDNPLGTVLTKERLVVREGATYKLDPKDWGGIVIVRVTKVDFAGRTAHLEGVVGRSYSASSRLDVDKVFAGAVEVSLSPDELQQMKWLTEPKDYADLAAVSKDFFLEHRGEINYYGSILVRDGNGKLNITDGYGAKRIPESVVYPDKSDKALIDELIAVYKDIQLNLGTSRVSSYTFASVAQVFFGADWEADLKAQLKTASPEELRAKAAEFTGQVVSRLPTATAEEISKAIGKLSYSYGPEPESIRTLMDEWMTASEFVNLPDARIAVNEAVAAEKARLEELKRQLAAEEERKQNEALKSDPNYKEIPVDITAKFEKIGVTIFYNTEDVQVEGFKRRAGSVYPAFNQLWMKDRAGKNGVVFRVKDILKNRFGAQFCSGVMRGDRKYGDSTWHVPASTNLDALYDLLS
jgi:SNF2 family DNA or RNA helicase